MRKLFGHKKSSGNTYDYLDREDFFEEENYEESFEEAEDAEEIYEEETYGEAYAEESYEEETYGEAYAEETYEEETYDEAYAEEIYEEETYDEAYAEETYDEETYGEVYVEDASGEVHEEEMYEMEANAEEGYEEQEDCEEEEQVPVSGAGRRRRRKGIFATFLKMSAMDKVITCTGAAVLIFAVFFGAVLLMRGAGERQMEEFVEVGSQLSQIGLPGEEGLLAMADAQAAKKAAAEALEEQLRKEQEEAEKDKEYEEEEYENTVTVVMELSSIQKDLKIKFVNDATDKLISNVPFTVTVTDPDGNRTTWTDDDMDGIIYKTKLSPGKYKVVPEDFENEKYRNYKFASSEKSAEVKEDIEYKKVDVKNEIKTEAEVNVTQEDTKKNETQVENKLDSTVEWVESTAKPVSYREVSKAMIADPMTLAYAGTFQRLAQMTASYSFGISTERKELTEGESFTLKAVVNGVNVSSIAWSSSDPSAVTVTPSGDGTEAVVKAAGSGSAEISYKVTGSAVSGGDALTGVSGGVCKVQVVSKAKLTLDKQTATAYTGEALVLNASLTGAPQGAVLIALSSDTSVAEVDIKDSVITVTGVKAGSVTVKVIWQGENQSAQAECFVTVKTHPRSDKETKLKDLNGAQVYVEESGSYREAVYADYYSASKFYVKGDVTYTGWQTIEGKVYYFDKDGKKVTGEQVIQGAKYQFGSDGALNTGTGSRGIDVSKWNGNIDWTAVKNSGIEYVIIRCGYRGSSQGALIEDPKFQTNIKGASVAGLKVGVYFFTQAINEVEAVEEASMVLELVKNYRISYPIFLDVEPSGGRADAIDKATRTAVCKAFCRTIQSGGYTAGIYANKNWLETKLNTGELNSYKIWLAQYASTPTYQGKYDLWQYQSTGKVSGISGDVDMNWSYLGY